MSSIFQCLLLLTTGTATIRFAQAKHKLQMCGYLDYALASPSFNKSIVKTQKLCFNLCLSHPDCKSANYFTATHMCALNEESHLDNSQKLKMVPGSFYAFTELLSDCSTPQAKVPTSLTECSEAWTEQELSLVGKPSTMSTTFTHPTQNIVTVADKAIDGDVNEDMHQSPYCAHTVSEMRPWWRVDLGGEHWLGRITVVNRGDCCGDRLAGATVRAGLSQEITHNMICGSPVSQTQAQNGAWIVFVCDLRILARYVSVDISNGNPGSVINICEVMVKEYVGVNNCTGHH